MKSSVFRNFPGVQIFKDKTNCIDFSAVQKSQYYKRFLFFTETLYKKNCKNKMFLSVYFL